MRMNIQSYAFFMGYLKRLKHVSSHESSFPFTPALINEEVIIS